VALIEGEPNEDDLKLAARITARFGQGRDAESVNVAIHPKDGDAMELSVTPLPASEVAQEWYI